jgi:hypothetical protein
MVLQALLQKRRTVVDVRSRPHTIVVAQKTFHFCNRRRRPLAGDDHVQWLCTSWSRIRARIGVDGLPRIGITLHTL